MFFRRVRSGKGCVFQCRLRNFCGGFFLCFVRPIYAALPDDTAAPIKTIRGFIDADLQPHADRYIRGRQEKAGGCVECQPPAFDLRAQYY
jgi:hypothetical protein